MNKKDEKNHINEKNIPAIAGALSGAITRMVVAPLDVLKIRFQIKNSTKSITTVVNEIINKEGLRYLWGGNLSAELLWIIYNGTQFGTYSYFQLISNKKNEVKNSLIYGSVSGIIATIISYPFDISRSYYANYGKNMKYKSLLSYFQSIYHQYNMFGLFRGLSPSIVEIIPSNAIKFCIFEMYCSFTSHSSFSSLIGGTFGGLISSVCLYPLDTIKKHMQLISNKKHPRYVDSIKYLYNEGKILRFYRGCIVTIMKSTVGSGFSFGFYNYFFNLMFR